MITVLWVSRHLPLKAQLVELENKLGAVKLVVHCEKVASAEEVAELAKKHGAKYVVTVLPLSIIAKLVELAKNYGFEVLYSRMELIASTKDMKEAEKLVNETRDKRTIVEYADGVKRVFEFRGFEKVKEVKLVTEPL